MRKASDNATSRYIFVRNRKSYRRRASRFSLRFRAEFPSTRAAISICDLPRAIKKITDALRPRLVSRGSTMTCDPPGFLIANVSFANSVRGAGGFTRVTPKVISPVHTGCDLSRRASSKTFKTDIFFLRTRAIYERWIKYIKTSRMRSEC